MKAAWLVGAAGYALGLLLSTPLDLPSGAVIVWSLVLVGLAYYSTATIRAREVQAFRSPRGAERRHLSLHQAKLTMR